MEKCHAMLRGLGEFATLNSFGTNQKLTYKFPKSMKRDWVKCSHNVLKNSGKQATFSDLVGFVRNESEEANSLHGRAIYDASKQSSVRFSSKKASVFGIAASSHSDPKTTMKKCSCPFYLKNHHLEKCEDFQRL